MWETLAGCHILLAKFTQWAGEWHLLWRAGVDRREYFLNRNLLVC
jgi:hypothetical protein